MMLKPKGCASSALAADCLRVVCSDSGWMELLSPAQARVLVNAGHVYAPTGAGPRR